MTLQLSLPSRSDFTLLALVVLASVLRVAFAADQVHKMPQEALGVAPFAQESGNIGYSLAMGKGCSNPFRRETGPTAWLTPIYPLIIAGTFKTFGVFTAASFLFLVFLNILFSTAACVPLFLAGKRVASSAVGLLAAFLWAVFPAAVMMPFEWIWDTSLSALLATTILWATFEITQAPHLRYWCCYGLLWGFALMTNPSLGSLLPFLLGWAAYRAYGAHRSPRSLVAPALALGITVLCCVPWTLRNYDVFHRLIPLRSNFPLELYIGNNENYDDKHPHFPGFITKERETLRYFRMGEIPFMDEEMRKAKAFIVAHPRVELTLFAKRFAEFWIGLPDALRNFSRADWLVRTLMVCGLVSGLGALAGLIVLAAQRSAFTFPLAVYPVVFPVLYYVTHTSLRYRHPIDAAVLLLTSVVVLAGRKNRAQSQSPRPDITTA